MILVLAIAAILVMAGRYAGVTRRAQALGLIVFFVLAITVQYLQLVIPEGKFLPDALWELARNWAIVAGIVGLIWGYGSLLKRLRERHHDGQAEVKTGTFRAAELDRYARHIVLREVGGLGQKKLKNAKVLVIGAGGLGAPALQYLAAAGVGTIGIVDDDEVDNSNLQRQVIHTDARIGMPKVFSAVEALKAQNPFITLRPYHRRLDAETATNLFADYDLILDGTDNFGTRYLVNNACVALSKPLISAAITQWEGQISLYHPAAGNPCYACVFPHEPDRALAPSCAEAGVMGALPGVVGSMMAVEAIKWITGAGETLAGRLMLYDALYADSRIIKISRNPDCAVCGGTHG